MYINSTWTKQYEGCEDTYVAQAIAWSESRKHATISATGVTADRADTKLMDALRELKLIPEASVKGV